MDNTQEKLDKSVSDRHLEIIKTLVKTHISALQCDPEMVSLFRDDVTYKDDQKITNLNLYARQRLRKENDGLKKSHGFVTQAMQHNFQLQCQLYKSIIILMRCKTLEEADQTLAKTIPPLLGIDDVMLYFENVSFLRVYDTLKNVSEGFCDRIIGVASSILGKVCQQNSSLYDHLKQVSESQAIIRMNFGSSQGLLVLSSYQKDCFSMDRGTEALNFFTRFLELYLKSWID